MEITKLHNQGSHLMIDAYDCDKDKLNDISHIKKFLEELPGLIDMNIIMEPKLMQYKADTPEEDGISGFTIIAESHISIHTYPKKGFFSFDVFSCKEFDIQKAMDYIVECFDVSHMVPQISARGFDIKDVLPHKVKVIKKITV